MTTRPPSNTPVRPSRPTFDPALAKTIAKLQAQFPWLPTQVLALLADGYTEHGDANLALTEFRNSDDYERFYAGNRREDGTLRYDEMGYYAYMERGRLALASVNVNPDLFDEMMVSALSGDIGIDQLEGRIDAIAGRVMSAAPAVRQFYAQNYGLTDLTDSTLVAMALDPGVSDRVFNNQLTNAEIGGEAALRGFGINLDMADALRQRGLDRNAASQVFSSAAESVPILEVLSRRHSDPADPFDINDFLAGAIFDDPVERQRMRRLVAQERGLYSPGAGVRQDTRGGGLTGLLVS